MQTIQGFRLSPQQRRLWRQQGGDVQWAQCAVVLDRPLDGQGLRDAARAAAGRHEILRTAFHREVGFKLPVQVVGDASAVAWSEAEGPADPAELLRSLREGADLSRGPLLRLHLQSLEPGRALLVASAPAVICDLAGLGHLLSEIVSGRIPENDPVQYADFAEWQNDLQEEGGEEAERARSAWTAELAARAAALALPFERQPSQDGFGSVTVKLPVRLQDAATDLGVGLPALVQAAWHLLIGRLTGLAEVSVSRTFDGRASVEDLGGAVGTFGHQVPVSVPLREGSSFASLAASVAEAARRAEAAQEHFPGEEADRPQPGFEWIEWTAAPPVHTMTATGSSPLALSVCDAGGSLLCEIVHTSAIRAEDAARLAGQVSALLESVAADPSKAIEAYDLRGAEDHRLAGLLAVPALPFNDRCLHELFEEQADRTPDAPAVVSGGTTLTYAELEARANAIAARLAGMGACPEEQVAILLDRSADVVIAILGVLKSGAAYVPLDPLQPRARLAAMLEVSGARLAITSEEHAAQLPPEVLALRIDGAGSSERLPKRVRPDNLAYVLFTSGSTGVPKGVMVEHRQIVAYVRGVIERLDLPAGASYALVSTFAADLGNTVLFPSLAVGGCLHVVSQEDAGDPEAFAAYARENGIDCLKIVPSHLSALLASGADGVLPRQRLVLGGEASRRELVEQALAAGCRVDNHYGPTETTVGVFTWRVEPGADGAVPIGLPLPGTRAFLLDRALGPVPAGAAGELLVGGGQVSRGYLGRPDATAERFVPDPEGDGARLYRTGDLARQRWDGAVEFLGRADQQIKLRGFRIEPGEIEAALAAHPRVRAAVVALREKTPGDPRLAGYVVPRDGETVTAQELRAFLRERLPDYMVPASLAVLETLPLTSNGKVDRAALPDPEGQREELERSYVPPGSDLEQRIAEIWRAVLKVETVGVMHNFFDLGGHSLAMVQVQGKVRQELGRDVSVVEMFRYPTVAALAAFLEEGGAGGPSFDASLGRAESRRAAAERQRQARARRGNNDPSSEESRV